MSAQNSISQLLEQFLELNTNSLETFNRINEAITTNKETVVIDLFNTNTNEMETIQIPAFGYLKREIERLNNNFNSISGIAGSDSTVRLKDGSYRSIHTARLKGPSKSITSLATPTTFSTKLNEFFEDFLNPLLTINLDVTGQIPVETERAYVERFIFNADDASAITAFDEIYKGSSEISYSTFTNEIKNGRYSHYVDSEVLDMPMRTIQYNGFFDVIKVDTAEKTYAIDGVSQTKTIKLYTVNKLTFSDSAKLINDTETLKINDSLIVNSGNYITRYQIVSIDASSSQLELLLLEGSESIKIGANSIGIYKDVDTNLDIEIKVGYNERQVVFVKPIDPNSKIPAESFSPGVAFYSNELEIIDNEGDTMNLSQYYRDEVSDFGQFIKSLKVDYIPPSSAGITPNSPVIDTGNFEVVQVNKHLTDNATTNKITQLKSDKVSTAQSLKKLDDSIKQKKALVNTKKFKSRESKDSQRSELKSMISRRDSESKLYASISRDIKTSAETSELQTVSPKFRVRGFWSIPEPKQIGNEISQEVIQFKIRYRYVSASGKTAEVNQINFTDTTNQTEKTAAFSNWTEVLSPVRKREKNEAGKFTWILEGEEDADAVNFNSFDIPIVAGETVEFMVKSLSEAGFPSNPLESTWSGINKINFPEGKIVTDSLGNAIRINELDLLRVEIGEDMEAAGITQHVADQFTVGDKRYSHNANSIASGFTSDAQSPISVYDKLLALQNEVLSLRGMIENAQGELLVRIIDEDGNITPVTNNSNVQLFAGYYTNEVPTTNGKGAIITKNFKIELSNTKATDLELISRIIGDTTKPAGVSSSNEIFGLGTGIGSIDPKYGNDAYYTNEGKYDLVPVVYQNIQGSQETWLNNGPDQSSQLKGQFLYSRFRNIANDDNLYVIDEGTDGDIDVSAGFGYDKYEYGISYNYAGTGPIVDSLGNISYNGVTSDPHDDTQSNTDFIWAGTWGSSTVPEVTSVSIVTNTLYSNGILLHEDHPLLKNGGTGIPTITPVEIQSNGLVGMPKTAPRRANDIDGTKQTPFRMISTLNNEGNLGIRSTVKNGFTPEDQYLLGGRSCGSFAYISPLNTKSLAVNAPNKKGLKVIAGGHSNAITIDMVFQYRMTDYYGKGSIGTGRVGGVVSNTLTNLTYAKKIGIDIIDNLGDEFTFDVEIYSKYTAQGKNINNINSSMLSNYNSSTTYTGNRRKYITDNSVDYSYPDITGY